jgi:hypothetical protein
VRDFALGTIILALAGYGLLHLWLGIIGWTWLRIMNPHAYSWRSTGMPVAATLAVAVLAGVLFTRDRSHFFATSETAVFMLFMLWMCITLSFSFDFDQSFPLWNRVMKIDRMVLVAMVVVMWWRSDKKDAGALVFVVAGVALWSLMPEQWWAWMDTFHDYQQDTSATGRINAWWMAWNLAMANFFGGGFMVSKAALFSLYAPNPLDVHIDHSTYFMALGEHGGVGLFLLLLLLVWVFVWRSTGRLRLQGKKLARTQWLSHLLGRLGYRWMDSKEWINEHDECALMAPTLLASNAKFSPKGLQA